MAEIKKTNIYYYTGNKPTVLNIMLKKTKQACGDLVLTEDKLSYVEMSKQSMLYGKHDKDIDINLADIKEIVKGGTISGMTQIMEVVTAQNTYPFGCEVDQYDAWVDAINKARK